MNLSPHILKLLSDNPQRDAHAEVARLVHTTALDGKPNGNYLVWRTDKPFSAVLYVREAQ